MCKVVSLLDRIAIDLAIPALARELFASHVMEYRHLDEQLDEIDGKLMKWHRANECSCIIDAVWELASPSCARIVAKTGDKGCGPSDRTPRR
ncbi:hypothetical protein [Sphingobium fuliginis]|uniref:Mobile element protein n=1 Tax=Sphingobium fuliginis (strain ATCC 27551) TaxID=336203 RepID=A0ABQ1ELV5_SPHSA|nr:hypothetical protein [Sphingobium fuliginis]GFZ77745.1 hypothetical protein GCM10019071_02720 [Sphingobium fuliginis]